jgi:hypothetical protein
VALTEAKAIVEAWCAPWGRGVTPAVVSALDVLVGDVIEEEAGARPDGTLVSVDGADESVLRAWTGGGGGAVARLLSLPERRVRRRLERDAALAAGRIAAWQQIEAQLGPIRWTEIAGLEVVSLAMGHVGPARQPFVLPVIASFLVATAASTNAALAAESSKSLEPYGPVFARLAKTSAQAFEELGRRVSVADPFSLPIPAYLIRL